MNFPRPEPTTPKPLVPFPIDLTDENDDDDDR